MFFGNGIATMNIVGLGDAAVKESKDRIEACISLLQYEFPCKKIIVNLSPSEIKKSGTYFDLAMLIGLLIESGQIVPEDIHLSDYIFLGKISTTGKLKSFSGALPMVIEAKRKGYTNIIIPDACLTEVSRVHDINFYSFSDVYHVIANLEKRYHATPNRNRIAVPGEGKRKELLTFSDVRGHSEILPYIAAAVAGNHNLLMIGAPGCGNYQ